MVNKFEVGKMYRYTGTEKEISWDYDGAMEELLDHKARKCLQVRLNSDPDAWIFAFKVRFDGIRDFDGGWYYTFDDMLNFELVD